MDYKIELILSFLILLLPILCISFTSYFFTKILKIQDFLEKLLIIFLLDWVQILLIVEFLSLFKSISLLTMVVGTTIPTIVCAVIFFKMKIKVNFRFRSLKDIFLNFFDGIELNKVLKIILICWLVIIIIIPFIIGLSVPPGNYDSMTYHLARAGFWKQYQSIDHFYTRAEIQNQNPLNAEIGLLWIILFTNSDNIAFLSQWLAFIIILIALYKLLRRLSYSRTVSILTVFLFASFDIVILEAYTTQNDLVITAFIALSIFFIIRSLEDEKINLKYIIFSGFAAGIFIGTKGYSYLFIPGIIIFLFLFGRNNRRKLYKILLLFAFSLVGVILFSSYGFIQNYLSYGNLFSSEAYVDFMRIENPGATTFLSNFSRYSASFYPYYSIDNNTVGSLIQRIINSIHGNLNFDISSPATTLGESVFYYFDVQLNYDQSYFGPLFFFLVLPATIFNLLLALGMRLWRRNSELVQRFKDYLKILVIPGLFFIFYTFIFKWQPYAGRLMIGFALLMMIGFAEFIDLLRDIKIKVIFNIFAYCLIFIIIVVSFFPLFFNDYNRLIGSDNRSIYSIKYEDRRGDFLRDVKQAVDENLGPVSRLGLILPDSDWVYILFGNGFRRELEYINDYDWNNKSIDEITSEKKLDGILINTEFKGFKNGDTLSFLAKITGEPLMEIDNAEFNDYFSPIKGCEFLKSDSAIIIKALNDDPHFETKFPFDFSEENSIIMQILIDSEKDANGQVFYLRKGGVYNEDDSERFIINKGENNIFLYINSFNELQRIRIDPVDIMCDSLVKKLVFYSIKDIKNIKVDNYILFY